MREVAFGASLVFIFSATAIRAQEIGLNRDGASGWPYFTYPKCPPSTPPYYPPNTTPAPKPANDPMANPPKDQNAPNPPAAPQGDQFAGATETGTQPGASFNPNMFGDLIGISAVRVVTIPGGFVTSSTFVGATSVVKTVPATTVAKGVPIAGVYTGFKVADNESPRPVDRVFFTYHGYSDVNRSQLPATTPSLNVQQQLIGFEKTFLGGTASVGMRLPFAQINGFSDVQSSVVGDLTLTSKYAWINNPETGNVLSTGLFISAPTGGGSTLLANGTTATRSTLLQPWMGYIYNMQRLYVQGFSSLVAPTSSQDPTIMFNSVGAGYWLYRQEGNRFLSALVPVAELHLNTPFDHRNGDIANPIFFKDQLNVTSGVYAIFGRATFGGAVGVPLVGPRPYGIEAIGSLNFRF